MKQMIPLGLSMYFDKDLVKKFSALEQNEKNFQVAEIVDLIIRQNFERKTLNRVAELGGGAHPDRYNWLFHQLIKQNGHIDWVDVSPYMLSEAVNYLNLNKLEKRKEVINFIESDILSYLKKQSDNSLDLCLMKYTIDYFQDINSLFSLFKKKLTVGGVVIANVGTLSPQLKSLSTNARFLYNGEEFPDNETRLLHDGDAYTVKFFKESGKPEKGYLEGAETLKYYHSPETLKVFAKHSNLSIFMGDWKQYFRGKSTITLSQDVIILAKL